MEIIELSSPDFQRNFFELAENFVIRPLGTQSGHSGTKGACYSCCGIREPHRTHPMHARFVYDFAELLSKYDDENISGYLASLLTGVDPLDGWMMACFREGAELVVIDFYDSEVASRREELAKTDAKIRVAELVKADRNARFEEMDVCWNEPHPIKIQTVYEHNKIDDQVVDDQPDRFGEYFIRPGGSLADFIGACQSDSGTLNSGPRRPACAAPPEFVWLGLESSAIRVALFEAGHRREMMPCLKYFSEKTGESKSSRKRQMLLFLCIA